MKSSTSVLFGIVLTTLVSASQAADFRVGDLVFPKSYPANLKVGTQATATITDAEFLRVRRIDGDWVWVESRNIGSVDGATKGWIKASDLDDLDAQLLWVNSLIEREPNEPYPYYYAGMICRLSDDPAYLKQGVSYFSRQLALAPADDASLKMRAYCWSRLNRFDMAIADMETAISLDPTNQGYQEVLQQYRDGQQYANGTIIPAPVAPVVVVPPAPPADDVEPSA